MVGKLTKYKIIELYLNDYGRKLYLREIASLLKKPHQTIKPYVLELVEDKILIETKRRNIIDYSLNFENKKIYDYLVIAEKEKLLWGLGEETLLNIFYEKLSSYFDENTYIIFGSSVDEMKKGSDIDLLIIGKKNVSKEIEEFEKVYNKKIHKVQVSNLDDKSLSFIKEIYKKHLILNDTERVIRFFGGLYEKNKLV